MSDQALARIEPQTMTIAAQPTPAEMLNRAIQAGLTADSAGAIEKLANLCEHWEDRQARRSAIQELRLLQEECQTVVAHKIVPTKTGAVKYKYAPYEDIYDQVKPLLSKYHFGVRFSQFADGQKVTVRCHLMHDSGHEFENEFSVRSGQGQYDTVSQSDVGSGTTAQREAFCDALNIVRRRDDDPRLEQPKGQPVTQAQADELERRVHESNSDWKAFLKFAGAGTFADIPASKYDELDRMLRRKEAKGK